MCVYKVGYDLVSASHSHTTLPHTAAAAGFLFGWKRMVVLALVID